MKTVTWQKVEDKMLQILETLRGGSTDEGDYVATKVLINDTLNEKQLKKILKLGDEIELKRSGAGMTLTMKTYK